MLLLRRLMLEDFGPYKGRQTVDFPTQSGVTVVYGENMRGKTSLLNAIRFALFGKVITRTSRELSLHSIGNEESAAEGKYGFKVVLDFGFEDKSYELTRSVTPRQYIDKPVGDHDYESQVFLRRDGQVLSPADRDSELSRVMPEQVSRFFLFDGELLQEYEDLLRDESDMGRRITLAIERILGLPILINARADLKQQQENARKTESKAAQKVQKTKELGNHLADLGEQRKHQEQELERLQAELEQLRKKKASLEEIIKQNERAAAMLKERATLERDINDLGKRRTQKEERLRDLMRDAWRTMLGKRVQSVKEQLQSQVGQIKERIASRTATQQMRAGIARALKEGVCATCERPLDDELRRRLESLISEEANEELAADEAELHRLYGLLAGLGNYEGNGQVHLIQQVIDDIVDAAVDLRSKQDRADEIGEQIRNLDAKAIREAQDQYDLTIKEITIADQGRKKTEDKLQEISNSIRDLERVLDKEAGSELTKDRQRRELYGRLYELFHEGVAVYRDRLRGRVEKDATELFLKLTTEPEYERLQINENYGLTILHRDGKPIRVRSAGAEHIVALSLMGALQKNAPLRGPIIMDSPFGRLDEEHTKRIVSALPLMAPQVVLLAYKRELDPTLAHNELLGNLRAEYKLVRQSARHTTIEPSKEV